MRRGPPRSTRTDTLLPDTTLFGSEQALAVGRNLEAGNGGFFVGDLRRGGAVGGHAPYLVAARGVGDEIEQAVGAEGGGAFVLARDIGDAHRLRVLRLAVEQPQAGRALIALDRKSSRLHSSH